MFTPADEEEAERGVVPGDEEGRGEDAGASAAGVTAGVTAGAEGGAGASGASAGETAGASSGAAGAGEGEGGHRGDQAAGGSGVGGGGTAVRSRAAAWTDTCAELSRTFESELRAKRRRVVAFEASMSRTTAGGLSRVTHSTHVESPHPPSRV